MCVDSILFLLCLKTWSLIFLEMSELPESIFKKIANCSFILLNKRALHKAIFCILNQLSEVYHESPRERSMCLQSFKQNSADLFLNLRHTFHKQIDKNQAEVESVRIRIPQLVNNRVQKGQSCLIRQPVNNLLKKLIVFFLCYIRRILHLFITSRRILISRRRWTSRLASFFQSLLSNIKNDCINNSRRWNSSSIDGFFAISHFITNSLNQLGPFLFEIIVQVIFQIVNL